MSRAMQQLREWIEAEYPGVRISRRSCRDTATGWVSQHSAYDYAEYDSNAIDIMGGPIGWTREQNVELIDEIVDAIREYEDEWSIRLVLWQVPGHWGHAHVDMWPTCVTSVWCGKRNVDPRWESSSGRTFTSRDPDPENGEYGGPEMTYTHFRVGEERAEWEPVVWWLYMLQGGDIDANVNSSQVQSKLAWKTNVRLVQSQDFALIANHISLSDANTAQMAVNGLYRFGKELAELRQIAYT